MPPVGFEPTFPASERPQTYGLQRAVTGTGVADVRTSKSWGCGLTRKNVQTKFDGNQLLQ